MSQYAHTQDPNAKIHLSQQQVHREIAGQIEQLVSAYRQDFLKTFEGLMGDHTATIGKLKKQVRE